MPDLPLELIEEVVEHIGRTHRKTLKAASVSARCFLVPCQKALFSHIGLRWGGPNSPGKRLLHTLQVSPHLATYVRNLGIFDDNGDEDEYVGQGEEWQCTHMDWLPRDQDAADLLEFLAGLGQLTEFQCWLSRKAEYWDSLPTKTKTSIVSLCSAPSLSRLVVKSVPLLLVDFKAGPTLEDMQVRFDDQGYYVSKPTPSTYPLVKLQSLTLLGNEEALDYAVGRIDMAHLRQLKIIEDMMGEPELGRVLPLCRSLETLVTPSSGRSSLTSKREIILILVHRESPSKSQRASPCLPLSFDQPDVPEVGHHRRSRGGSGPAPFNASLQLAGHISDAKPAANHRDRKPLPNCPGVSNVARRPFRSGVGVCR